MPETFETRVWNKRKEPVQVYDKDGSMVAVVLPDEISIIESANKKTLLSPYSEVIFREDGEVSLTPRPKWVLPYDKARPCVVTIENHDGKDLEQRIIAGQPIYIPKGIPVHVSVPTHAPEARLEKIIIQKVMERKPSPIFTGYWVRAETVKDTHVERSAGELEQIEAELKKPANKLASEAS
jgi:hypothetical protein